MTFSNRDLHIKINKQIDDLLADGYQIATAWLVNLLIQKVNVPKPTKWKDSREHEEAILAMREGYRQIVSKIIRKRKGEEAEEDYNDVLPGFLRVQKTYIIVRKPAPHTDPQEMIVPIEDMTLPEALAKVQQLKGMRRGLDIHIAELERYIKTRWPETFAA